MKKLLLGLGSITAVVAPVAAVISCGDDSKTTPAAGATPAAAIDLTNKGSSVWHGLFHKSHARSLPEVGTKLEVTVNGTKLEYTWAQADTDALAGYVDAGKTKGQADVIQHLATKLKGTHADVTTDDIIKAFNLVGHHGIHLITIPASVDLTAAHSDVWHNIFYRGQRTLPKDGQVFTVTVNTHTLTYTWATATDDSHVSGFIASTPTMGQSGVLDYLATQFAATTSGVTKAQVLEAFGVTRLHHHDMAVGTGQPTATVALTAPADGSKIKLSDVVSAVWTNADFGTTTTAVNIELNGATLAVTLTAGANPDAVKAAINTAIAANTAFTGCFDTSRGHH